MGKEIKSNKIYLDQYYTPSNISEYSVNKTIEIIGRDNISDVIEPSAGQGIYLTHLDKHNLVTTSYDIAPKIDRIIKQDFLTLEKDYLKNRLIIGNPPYGSRLSLALKFYNRSCDLGDYISFILPISQLDNVSSFYKFDLIYSEDLGEVLFSNSHKVHCCLNIYRRPKNNILNKKTILRLKDIKIYRNDHKNYNDISDFDIRICGWGNGSAGKILTNLDRKYSCEYKIKIYNVLLRDDIINLLHEVNWREEKKFTAMIKIQQKDIIMVLKKYIKDIK